MKESRVTKAVDCVLWKMGLVRRRVMEQHVELAIKIDHSFKRLRDAHAHQPEPEQSIDQMVDEYMASRYVGLRVRRDTNGELRATKAVQP